MRNIRNNSNIQLAKLEDSKKHFQLEDDSLN